MSSLEETTTPLINLYAKANSNEALKLKLKAIEEKEIRENKKGEREKLKDKRPISVLTDYPEIYAGTYWGTHLICMICNVKVLEENINNRNNFIKDYNILKRVGCGERPRFISEIITISYFLLDHIEVYKTKDGKYVIVSSPNKHNIKEHLDDGWTQIYSLYFRSPSFIKITNYKEYTEYKQSTKPPCRRLKDEVWKLCNSDNYEGKCFCCNEVLHKPKSKYGYIKPVSNGGKTLNSNLKAICKRCYKGVGDNDMDYWIKMIN